MRILFLDLDTLRPDHLGCYGYPRATSPALDRIAAEGLRFDQYYCSDAPCLPSRAALVSGMFGIRNGAVGHGGTAGDLRLQGRTRMATSELADQNLWNVFRRAGYYTASISPFAERHSAFWFYGGFREMHNPGGGGMESAEQITPTVLAWLEAHGKQDHWLLHVNYWDAHTPYRAPASFGHPFADAPLPTWIDEAALRRHQALAGPKTARDNGMYHGRDNPLYPRHPNDLKDMAQLRRCLDGYDTGIRYLDSHVGQLLAALERLGVLDETAILVTADHGENFGELGLYSEHGTADPATCRIPMIVRWPGVTRPGAAPGWQYQLDLAPTMAELLGVAPSPLWDGRSYVGALRGRPCEGRDELVLSQCVHVCQRAVRWDRWLYLRTRHDGFHPHFGDEMLFDLAADPHEQCDVAAQQPAATAEGALRLAAWQEAMMRNQPYGYAVDPLETVLAEDGPLLARRWMLQQWNYFRRLEETGRGHWIEAIRKRHPDVFA